MQRFLPLICSCSHAVIRLPICETWMSPQKAHSFSALTECSLCELVTYLLTAIGQAYASIPTKRHLTIKLHAAAYIAGHGSTTGGVLQPAGGQRVGYNAFVKDEDWDDERCE
jgi:hypothetical protein